MKISKLRVNHLTNPLGFKIERPVFSYLVTDAAGQSQASGRIRIATDMTMSDIVYDSGDREDMDSIAFPVDLDLSPRTRYYWQVDVITDAGDAATSAVAWFETAKMGEDWAGEWICSDLNQDVHPVFYTSLPVNQTVRTARLYICGLGLYEAYIDEEKVGDEYLTPYCNDYTQWLQYQTYDVTRLLASGDRKLEVLLGNGWYKGRFGLDDDGTTRNLYGDTLALIAEIHITYEDGSTAVFGTQADTWQARKSYILNSSFYDGEEVDMTLDVSGEFPVHRWDITATKLADAKLKARMSLPIRVQEVRRPARVIQTPKDELVLDIGQNHSGWFSLKIREARGTRIRLSFGEALQDGCFYNGNLRTARSEYVYVSDGEERTIRPHFTTFGYRYVKLEGVENFREEDYEDWIIYSDLEQTAWVTTGNLLVDQLAKNSIWGQKSNFLDIPMDCPQRDERMGWTGDAQVFAPAACINMDSYAFYAKFLFDAGQEQKHRQGAVPFTVPACGQKATCGIWGDAATIIPWTVYLNYGDRTILEQQYDSMKAWVDFVRTQNGDSWNWRNGFAFGDWLALDSRDPKMPTGGTDTGYLVMLYNYNSLNIVAQAAEILGKPVDAQEYRHQADLVKEEILQEYFSAHGRLCCDTQTGYLAALKFGIAPDEDRIREALRHSFSRNDDKLETGFVGTGMLCDVLADNGMAELAYSLLLYEGYPGWLYSVKSGATTCWERWDSLDEDGHFSDSGLNSLNHYAYGAIAGWLFKYAAGIRPRMEAPGYRVVDIAPLPDYRLGQIHARLDTPVGTYESDWEVTARKGITVRFSIPFGGKAYIRLPYAPTELYRDQQALSLDKRNPLFANVQQDEQGFCCLVSSGFYELTYDTSKPMGKTVGVTSSIRELLANERTKAVLMNMLPMISMLPESMHGKSLLDVIQMGGKSQSHEQLEELNRVLGQSHT